MMTAMKHIFPLWISLSLLVNFELISQNLIQNPGFEEIYPNPGNIPAKYWRGWKGAGHGMKLFTRDSLDQTEYSHVTNTVRTPHGGNSYIGLSMYRWERKNRGPLSSQNDGGRLVQTALKTPLEAGKRYRLSFYISLSDSSNKAVERIGGYFSNKANFKKTTGTKLDMDIKLSRRYDDRSKWHLAEAEYVAKGGEKFLTIGWMDLPGLELSSRPVSSPINEFNVNHGDFLLYSYYYLDDFSLEEVSEQY